jgi:hypothetical protein
VTVAPVPAICAATAWLGLSALSTAVAMRNSICARREPPPAARARVRRALPERRYVGAPSATAPASAAGAGAAGAAAAVQERQRVLGRDGGRQHETHAVALRVQIGDVAHRHVHLQAGRQIADAHAQQVAALLLQHVRAVARRHRVVVIGRGAFLLLQLALDLAVADDDIEAADGGVAVQRERVLCAGACVGAGSGRVRARAHAPASTGTDSVLW